jgi:uncharacterized membrane protein YqjE
MASHNSTSERELNTRPIAAIVSDLGSKAEQLVRQERQLANAELQEKLAEAKRDAIALGGLGVMLTVALLTFVSAIVFFLAQYMALWQSAGLVSLVSFLIAGFLAWRLRRASKVLTHSETAASVKQDVKVLREAADDAF